MSIKKIEVDKETCIGCGQCVNIAGKAFKLGCDGTSQVLETWKEEDPKKIQEAAESCPTKSIIVSEE